MSAANAGIEMQDPTLQITEGKQPTHDVEEGYPPSEEAEEQVEYECCPALLTCTVTGFFGKSGLGAGCFIVVALDVLAFILLLIGACCMHVLYSGAMMLASSIFYILTAMLVAGAIFVKSRDVANILIWVSLVFHCLLIVLCFAGLIWNIADFAGKDPRGSAVTGLIFGLIAHILYIPLTWHFIQVTNSWRVRNVGGKPVNDIFNTGSNIAEAPKH